MIKNITRNLLALLIVVLSNANAQTILSGPSTVINNLSRNVSHWNNSTSGLGKTALCSADTLNYLFNKTTTLQTITMNTSTSGNMFLQWYPAPQPITVHGFEFYAWQAASSSAVIPITCRIFNANPIDSLPSGPALASVVVNVDSTFGSGLLTTLRKVAVFTTPVTVTGPYIITIETGSTTNVAVVTNSWTASPPNGRSEWLSSIRIGTNTIRSYNVNVGGVTFNADALIQPFTSFSLTADFIPSTRCNQGGNNITFTNTSSPVLFNRFYSVRAFQNIPQFSCMWDYGDMSGTWYSVNGNRTYLNRAPYTVTLKDTLLGWTRGCVDTKQEQIFAAPVAPNAYSNSPLCLGGTLQLSCDTIPGATSYYWTGPNGYNSIQQNPTVSGITILNQGDYQVRAISGQCTSFVSTVNVTIISTPVASNNGPLCTGQQLVLSISNIAGATYNWSGPNGFTSNNLNPSKPNVSVSDTGTYAVTVTLAGCGTIGPYTTYVSVNPVPAAPVASNNGPLCIGDNLNLSASNITGATYSWTGPNGFSASQQNPTRPSVLNAFAGTYTVTATVAGCTSPTASTVVIINNIPTAPSASSNAPLCVNQTLSLTATPIPGATYNWSGPGSFASTIQNPTRDSVQTSYSGVYSVYAVVNGCPSAVTTISVSITTSTPTPVASSNAPICPGQDLQLTASNIPGATYSWTGPNSFTSNLQNPSITGVSTVNAGLYNVTAITAGCGMSTAGSTNVVVNTLPPAPNITSNSPLCDGQTLQLNANTITGATYSWTGPDGFSSNLQNPTISSVSQIKAGTYSVSVNVTGCGTSPVANATIVIRRNPVPPTPTSNSPVCNGDTIRFNASASGTGPNRTFSWTGPNNFNAIVQQPILPNANSTNAGVYQLTVTDSGCTSSPALHSVSLKSIPQAPLASNNGPVCEGSAVQLNASFVSSATYRWSGPNSFVSFNQNPAISSIRMDQSGTYSVVSIVNGCSSTPASTTVAINPQPQTPDPSNNGPVCVGSNIQLSTDAVAGAVYNWTGPNGFNSVLRSPIIANATLANAGDYNVVIFIQTCGSTPGVTKVEVNPIPAPPVLSTSPTSGNVCAGDSILLFANFVSGATYEWTGPAGFGSTLQNPVLRNVLPVYSGAYSATITKNNCQSNAATTQITVNETPQTSTILGPDSVRNFETQTYQVTGDVGSVFNWVAFGGTQQSGGTTNTITVLWGNSGNGFVRVRETNVAGCRGVLQQQNVYVRNTTGINENELTTFSIYPNPAIDKVYIQPQTTWSGNEHIVLINLLGQTVYTHTQPLNKNQDELSIDVAKLKSGMYLLQISDGGITRTAKVQVAH